jgi:hypothetical protein
MGSMSFIYGASYFTLVVAGGDDTETGLPRVHRDSPSNDLVQHLGTVASIGVLLPLKQLLEAHSVSVCSGPVVDTGHPWMARAIRRWPGYWAIRDGPYPSLDPSRSLAPMKYPPTTKMPLRSVHFSRTVKF